MLKNLIRSVAQKILGYDRYLFLFARFNVWRIQKNSQYEDEFKHFMQLIPKENGVILDIGANIGVMSVSLALEHPQANIYSFEPIPDNHATIEQMIGHYQLRNVELFKVALGEEKGEIKMVVPVVGNSNMQGLSHVVEIEGVEPNGHYYSVPVMRLDDIAELQAATRITAIKIDVENFEYYVLKGGRQLLSKHKPIIYCELWNNERRQLCFDYLRELGYQVRIYQHGALHSFEQQEVTNFFFIP